jgi:hypothetical protein
MKTLAVFSLLLASLASPLGAAVMAGPVSGYVLDQASHSLRPINGIPGGASLGSPLVVPFPVGMAAVSLRQDYALLTEVRGGDVFLATNLHSGQPTVAPLAGAISASNIVLSGSGTSAILYSSASHQLQFVSGLPGSPAAGSAIDASQAGAVSVLALDGPGSTALLLASDGGLYIMSASGGAGPQFIARISGASSAAILADGTDAVVGNSTTGDVLLVGNFASSAAISTLAGAGQGITSARDVAAVDAHHAGVIDGTGKLAVIDLDTAAVSWITLAGAAEHFNPLDTGVLLLNHPGQQALLLLTSAQGGTPYFVPPAADTTSIDTHRGAAIWTHR